MSIALQIGTKMLTARWKQVIRQAVAATFFAALIFTMVVMNLSFNQTFREAQDQTQYSPVVITDDEIRFMQPTDQWVWNTTQVVLDKGTVKLLQPLERGFTVITIVVSFCLFLREVSESYSQAKRDNDEHQRIMGTLYAIGVQKSSIYGIFILEKLVAFGIGFAGGIALSVYLLVPQILIQIDDTTAGLFFRAFDYPTAAIAAAMFVMLSVVVKSAVLTRGTGRKPMVDAIHEIV